MKRGVAAPTEVRCAPMGSDVTGSDQASAVREAELGLLRVLPAARPSE
jgi:hypothetical protein